MNEWPAWNRDGDCDRQDTPYNRALAGKPLSAKQVRILEYVREGYTNVEIADDLGIAPNTVKSHLSHIFRQMGARDRGHAIAVAYRTGIFGGHADIGFADAVHIVRRFTVTGEGRTLRKSLNITTREIARLCDVTIRAVQCWETGRLPTTPNMMDYARILLHMQEHGRLPDSLA